jgi:hypothetical protein
MPAAESLTALVASRPDVAASALVRAGTGTILAIEPRGHCTAVDIRDELWATVPTAQLPDLVLVVPRLPRDPTAAELLDFPGACGFVAPETPTELELAAIWRAVLGRRWVAVHDDFFELGGDAVTGTLLLDVIDNRFGVALPYDEFLERPSLHAIAFAIERRRRAP